MNITQATFAPYIGGQVEIQNQREGYLYRGEITEVTLDGTELSVKLSWMAKGEDFPPIPSRWVVDDPKPYNVSLAIYTASNIGDNRLTLNSTITGELVVFFPKGGSRLDPTNVEGL